MASMSNKFRKALATASLCALAATAAPVLAQMGGAPPVPPPPGGYPPELSQLQPVPDTYTPEKTAWGDPDFRGGWPIDNIASLPMNRPKNYGDRFYLSDEEFAQRQAQANRSDAAYDAEDKAGTIGMGHWVESDASGRRTSLLVDPADGQLPAMTPEAQKKYQEGRSSWNRHPFNWVSDFDTWDRCVTRGFPASMFPFRYNNGIKVMQAPGYFVIALEMIHDARIIPVVSKDKWAELQKTRWPENVRTWMGQSLAYWDDDNTIPTSTKAKVIERLTMTGPDSIVYELTYSDPEVFTAPWTARLDWTRNDEYEFFEYACHEGNVQVRNYITADRAGRLGDLQDAQLEGDAPSGGSQ